MPTKTPEYLKAQISMLPRSAKKKIFTQRFDQIGFVQNIKHFRNLNMGSKTMEKTLKSAKSLILKDKNVKIDQIDNFENEFTVKHFGNEMQGQKTKENIFLLTSLGRFKLGN